MQDSSENLEAIDNTRTRTREICARINEINLTALRRRKRIETRETPEQLVIVSRTINIVAAESEHHNFGTSVDYLPPFDLRRGLMLAA
jgi:hypothetical protein